MYWNKGINLEIKNPGVRNFPFYYIHTICNAIILYSEKEKKDIWKINRHKISVANNAVNFANFPFIDDSKEKIKKEFKIPFKKVVLFVGRMRGVKKVEHIIQVFNHIDLPDTGLVIVGDSMGADLSSIINKKNTIYLGEIYDPRDIQISKIFKMSDIFCIPGDVGLGLNQAFYWGLPVVTEDGLQPPEINYLTPGRNGFIVPENDLSSLKEKLILLLENDTLRKEFSENARKDIMENGSIERMFSGFLDCTNRICNKK
ncbi:MAG: glycosyltransferase family 4 protein [Fibrobacter sp.]|nr:glycosyltransferase family 4 protein [Fibrobacter sp.]